MTTIRPAIADDLDTLFQHAKTMATSFEVERAAFEHSFKHHLENTSSALLVAEVDKKVIGYCLGYDHYAFYANGRISWLEELFVIEQYRKHGIGRQLMQGFEAWARSRHSKLVALATRRASHFYLAIGYEESAVYFRKLI